MRASEWITLATCFALLCRDSAQISVIEDPQDVAVLPGEDATLTCRFDSAPPLCIWIYTDEFPLTLFPDGVKYSLIGNQDEGDCSLLIQSVETRDTGIYSCSSPRTAEDDGANSREARVSVLVSPEPPVLWYQGVQVDPQEGIRVSSNEETINVTCISQDGNPEAALTWMFNGNTILATPDVTVSTIDPNLLTASIGISRPAYPDINFKLLTCIANHPTFNGSETVSALIKIPGPVGEVQAILNYTKQTQIELYGDESVDLICAADGEPTPNYRWDKQVDSEWTVYYSEQIARRVQERGTYSCVASNEYNEGEIRSPSNIDIIVNDVPPAHQKAKVGMIIGIVFGVLVFVAIVIALLYYSYTEQKWCFHPTKRNIFYSPRSHKEKNAKKDASKEHSGNHHHAADNNNVAKPSSPKASDGGKASKNPEELSYVSLDFGEGKMHKPKQEQVDYAKIKPPHETDA